MHDVLYLHGFGDMRPERCRVAQALKMAVPEATIHTPCYHPEQRVAGTRIGRTLKDCVELIERSKSGKVYLVGYSFGGLLAALLALERQDLIENVLLLAPAIDNYERNYATRNPKNWQMPAEYVEELQLYPARPDLKRPTTVVHGMLDVDMPDLPHGAWRNGQECKHSIVSVCSDV